MDPRNPLLAPGQLINGFLVEKGNDLPNLRAHCWELRHQATGARHLHISHELDEKVFITCLRTLPQDDTGVPHILEHTVLEGSRQYPVKMFTELRGRSLNSFLNAFTGPDRTAYPFATPNDEDWDNLLTRYLDAVFHPLLEEEAFLQEGWRLEFQEAENPATPLVLRGVVYNEMKAAMSSAEGQFARRFRRELLPDLCYANESGGDPAAIPQLSVEAWRAFHERHYHPGNSWTATFGNQALESTLARLDQAFQGFEHREALELGAHPSLGAPVVVDGHYPVLAGKGGPPAPRFAAVGWRLCSQQDMPEMLRLAFLFEVLCGGLAAPLNHALLQSGLGPALAPVGLDSGSASLTFGIGLKGVEKGSAEAVERVVLEALTALARDGLDPGQLQAALDRFELENREQSRVWGMPWGLSLLYFSMPHWMAGGDPAPMLRNDLLLESLRKDALDPDFLPGLIRRWLLENPERLRLELEPREGAVEAREEQLAHRLAEQRAAMDEEACHTLVQEARRVEAWRGNQGDLSCMPVLDPARQPRQSTVWPGTEFQLAGGVLHVHDQPVNGLAHVKLALPLDPRDPDLALVDLMGWITRISHAGLGTEASERRLRGLSGGVSLGSHHSLEAVEFKSVHHLHVGFHALARRHEDWLSMIEDLLRRPDLHDARRVSELLRMRQAGLHGELAGGASQIAMQASQHALSPIGSCVEQAEGLGFLRHLAALDPADESLGQRLQALLERCLSQRGRQALLCADGADMQAVRPGLENLLNSLPLQGQDERLPQGAATATRAARALLVDVDGAFVAESRVAPSLGDPDAARLSLLAAWMEQPLYERIRAKGGAYGAMATYDSGQRVFSFVSWRDPRIAGTWADFDEVRRLALGAQISREELDRAKIEALRRLDRPLLPHERASRSFQHALHGVSLELRNQYRQGLLDATAADVAECASRWLADDGGERRVVVCPQAMLRPDVVQGLVIEAEEALGTPGRSA